MLQSLGHALFTGAADEGYTSSSSRGETRILPDAAGTPLRSWRFGGLSLRPLHAAARRPVGLLVDEGAGKRLVGLSVFGDARRDLALANLTLGDDRDDSGTHGQTTAMNDRGAAVYHPHLKTGVSTHLVRDFRDQHGKAELDNAGNVSWYATDAAGERVRKVWDKGSLVEERIDLCGYEVWRKRYGSGVLQEERQTLHIMDDKRRVAMIETLPVTGGSAVSTPTPRFRYQLDDQLGSSLLEVDDDGGVNRYEEVHPYGTTAWWAEDAAIEVSRKRVRYTGKERAEETGLQVHSARYYAPWLGRWDRPDPIGLGDGGNRYRALRNSPALHSDPSGLVPPDGPSTGRAIGVPEEAIGQAQYYPFGEPGLVKPNGDFKVPVLTYDVAVVVFYTGDPEFDAAQRLHAHVQIAGVVETRAKANISVNATEIPMDASLLSDPAMFDATSLFFFPNSDDMSTVLRLAEQRGEVPPFILVISPGGIHVSDDQNSTYGGINIPRTPFMVVAGVWAVNEEGRTLEKGKFTASHEFGHKEGLWHTSLDDLCNTDVMQDPVHPFERHEAEFKDTQSDIMRRFAEEQQ